MAYLDVITLADAKEYLGVDDTSRDVQITQMIKSALSFIEKQTRYIMDAQDREYIFRERCARVYDHPINTSDSSLPSGVERVEKGYYSRYTTTGEQTKLTLNVGSNTIPDDLVQAGYLLIEHFFNEKETGNRLYTLDTTRFPVSAMQLIDANKRFLI